jgi:hypothetical protein
MVDEFDGILILNEVLFDFVKLIDRSRLSMVKVMNQMRNSYEIFVVVVKVSNNSTGLHYFCEWATQRKEQQKKKEITYNKYLGNGHPWMHLGPDKKCPKHWSLHPHI